MFNNSLDVIKRGSKIIFMQYRQIAFVDSMTFGPGCSLDEFGKMWGAAVKKGCFPYEKYLSIEQLVEDTEWPALVDFTSKLSNKVYKYSNNQILCIFDQLAEKIQISMEDFRQKLTPMIDDVMSSPVDLDVYCQMWAIFEHGKQEKTINNMMDYLCYYNALDTEVLCEAMEKYISSFLNNFGICPNEYVTLPAIAETILWHYYDDSLYLPYSFNEEFADVSKLIRSQLAGGLSCVFSRHVEIGDCEIIYDSSVYHAENGQRFTQLVAFDVNSKFCSLKIYYQLFNYKVYHERSVQ